MKIKRIFFLIFFIIAISFVLFNRSHRENSPNPISPQIAPVLEKRTKTSACEVQGPLQDKACTPGAIIPTATIEEICTQGYAKSVRNVPVALKHEVYKEYGIAHHSPGEYEVDHLISLELGGSNDIANLWPEPAEPKPGFHEKDKVENYLHKQVCEGKISLQEAQKEISENWLLIYKQISQ